MEHHHHHDESGLIYYNESDLARICGIVIEYLQRVQQKAIQEGKVWDDIASGGKIELLTEMKEFFEHKI